MTLLHLLLALSVRQDISARDLHQRELLALLGRGTTIVVRLRAARVADQALIALVVLQARFYVLREQPIKMAIPRLRANLAIQVDTAPVQRLPLFRVQLDFMITIVILQPAVYLAE